MKNLIPILLLTSSVFFYCDSKVSRETKDGVLYINNPKDGLWQDRKDDPIKFELEMTFGVENEPEEEMFSSIGNVFTDANSNVYIFDRKDNRFVCFNKEGVLKWSKGREGEGPGEFKNVYGVVFDGSTYIYFGNLHGNRIDKFDLNGNFIKSINLLNTEIKGGRLVHFTQPEILILKDSESGKNCVHLKMIDLKDLQQIQSEIFIEEDIGVKIPNMISLSMSTNFRKNEIVLGSLHTYKFSYYNLDGVLQKVITRDFNKIMRPGVDSGENYASVVSNGDLSALMKLSSDIEICFLSWPTNIDDPDAYFSQADKPDIIFRNAFDFYNNQGELLYSIYSDGRNNVEIGRPIYVDSEGKLYTTLSDPFPQVRRYNVIFKK